MNLAYIGLGTMGYEMAKFLVRPSERLCVYNRTQAKAEQFVEQHGGVLARSPAEAADEADFVMLCVGRDEDVRSVCTGAAGVLDRLKPGAVLIDHTTGSAILAQELAASCERKACSFLDAPVSGGQLGAQKGQLSIMCGGTKESFEKALPVLQHYGKKITHIGETGAGQLAKMVNQICIGGLLQALAEGLHFGRKAGLDMTRVLEAISTGAAQSWQMENRAATMLEGAFDFGFAVKWMRKDLGLCLAEAHRLEARLPVTALVDQFYTQLAAEHKSQWDTSSLMALLDSPAGPPEST